MALPGEEIDQDLSHIHWSWPEAIAANPARSLANADLAMDYFAYSPFWDTKSNNNVLRTQRRVENPTYGHAEEKIELNAFKSGFEYIVSHAQPPELFVIQKREVDPSGKRDRVTGSWFILQERIYQSPTIYDVVSARLRNASHLISKTLTSLSESHPSSNPRTTTLWRSLPPDAEPKSITANTTTTAPEATLENTMEIDENEGDSTETGKKEGESKKGKEKSSEFDWNLYHSLQSTRMALSTLDQLSKKPTEQPNPLNELKSIEAQLSTQFGIAPQQPQRPGGGSVRSISTNKNSIPLTMANGAGSVSALSPSTTIAGFGLTPGNLNMNMNIAPSPRNLQSGISPASLGSVGRSVSVVGAGSPANLLQ